jgi:hypothetical protein
MRFYIEVVKLDIHLLAIWNVNDPLAIFIGKIIRLARARDDAMRKIEFASAY